MKQKRQPKDPFDSYLKRQMTSEKVNQLMFKVQQSAKGLSSSLDRNTNESSFGLVRGLLDELNKLLNSRFSNVISIADYYRNCFNILLNNSCKLSDEMLVIKNLNDLCEEFPIKYLSGLGIRMLNKFEFQKDYKSIIGWLENRLKDNSNLAIRQWISNLKHQLNISLADQMTIFVGEMIEDSFRSKNGFPIVLNNGAFSRMVIN